MKSSPAAGLPNAMADISIIIPTYNRPVKCKTLLLSLISQVNLLIDRHSIEIIVVDDDSREKNRKIIKVFLKNYSRYIRYYELERNVGAGEARNYGIKKSTGKLLIFLDDDYVAAPNYVFNMIDEYRKHPEIMILNGYVMKMRDDFCSNYYANSYEAVFNHDERELCQVRMVSSGNFAIKREVLNVLYPLFDGHLWPREDFDLYLRAQDAGIGVYRSKKPVTYNDCRSTLFSLFKQYWQYAAGEYLLIKKYGNKRLREEYRLHVAQRKKKYSLLNFFLRQSYRLHIGLLSIRDRLYSRKSAVNL